MSAEPRQSYAEAVCRFRSAREHLMAEVCFALRFRQAAARWSLRSVESEMAADREAGP